MERWTTWRIGAAGRLLPELFGLGRRAKHWRNRIPGHRHRRLCFPIGAGTRHTRTDPDGYRYAHTNSYAYPDSKAPGYPHSYANSDPYSDPYPRTFANRNPNPNQDRL